VVKVCLSKWSKSKWSAVVVESGRKVVTVVVKVVKSGQSGESGWSGQSDDDAGRYNL
jgi:hypothetical protein